MSEGLRFAIIGCGKIAPRHATEAMKHGVVAAVCDVIPSRANELSATFNATPYVDIKELLRTEKGIDIVAVCTPNGLHAEHSELALAAGAHVLCEKPLSINIDDANRMIAAAEKARKKLFVVKSTRYNPILSALKLLIDDGKLGNVYNFQLNCFWNRPVEYYKDSWKGGPLDGGTLYTQFSHYIDAMRWLFGDIKNVWGARKNFTHQGVIESEDSGVAAIETENGILGGLNWSVNSFQKNMEISLTVIAEKGTVRIGGEYLNKIEYQLMENESLNITAAAGPNDYGFYKGSMSHHDSIYSNMVKAIRDDTHPFTYAIDGLKTVEAIGRIYNSIALS